MSDPLHGWLRWAAETVLPDLQQPVPVALELRYGLEEDGLELLWVHEDGDPAPTGYLLPGGLRGTELLVWMADWLQSQVLPTTRAAWGEPRPACPGHRHPLQAAAIGGAAWWICPATRAPVTQVGRVRPPLA